MSRDSPDSPDLFERRDDPIILDSDEDTEEVPFPNAQDLNTDDEFDAPPTPPGRWSPMEQEDDYLVRVEREIRRREDSEYAEQLQTPGYMRILRDMIGEIDEWLGNNGGVAPFPEAFKRFIRHNWCVRIMTRTERIRINKLRLRYDVILEEADERRENQFWDEVERNEPIARTLNPACTICRFDIRNESFVVTRLDCGHLFHLRCINTHLLNNPNPRCPNCMEAVNGPGGRVYLNYQ